MNKIILIITILCFSKEVSKAQLLDIDGNVYDTRRMGAENLRSSELLWMTSNLNTSRFKNGEVIKEAKSNEEWEDALNKGIPAWCYLDNDSSNGRKLGKLYNYYAVTNLKGLAPEGWHIASDFEWEMVYKYYKVQITDGNLYEDFKIFMSPKWKSPYPWGYGNNKTGFNAMPSGYRASYGFLKAGSYYWGDIKLDRKSGAFHSILGDVYICDFGCELTYKFGFSIRCVKDC